MRRRSTAVSRRMSTSARFHPAFDQPPPPVTPADVDTRLAKLGASSEDDLPDNTYQDPAGGAIGIPQPEQERDTDTKAVEPQGAYNGLDYLVPFPGDPDDD